MNNSNNNNNNNNNNNVELELDTNLHAKYKCLIHKPLDVNTVDELSNNLFDYLKDIYPEFDNKYKLKYIKSENINNLNHSTSICIEIRVLMRRVPLKDSKEYSKKQITNPCYDAPNYRIFSFSTKERERFIKYIRSLYKKGTFFCLYYSLYNFDNSVLTKNSKGIPKPVFCNTISSQNVFSTQRLLADFDHVSEDEFRVIYKKLEDAGLTPTYTIFSGHGFQTIWVLDKLTTDLTLLSTFNNYLINTINLDADPKVKDCARIARCPYSFNSKEFASKDLVTNKKAKAIYTYIYKKTNSILSLDDIRRKTSATTSIVAAVPVKKYISLQDYSITNNVAKLPITNFIQNFIYKTYQILDGATLPDIVYKQLLGFQKGYANNSLMFLTHFFKEQGFSINEIIIIIDILKNLDTFNYAWTNLDTEQTVKRIYYTYDKATSLSLYIKNNLSVFGFYKYVDIKKDKIVLNHFLFKHIKQYTPNGLYLYLQIHRYCFANKCNSIKMKQIINESGFAKSTVCKLIKNITRHNKIDDAGLLDKSRANVCYFDSFFTHEQTKDGFFTLSISSFNLLTNYVKNDEMCVTDFLVALILKEHSRNNNQCFLSHKKIASFLGFSSTGAISRSIHTLENLGLISILRIPCNNIAFKNNYTINF